MAERIVCDRSPIVHLAMSVSTLWGNESGTPLRTSRVDFRMRRRALRWNAAKSSNHRPRSIEKRVLAATSTMKRSGAISLRASSAAAVTAVSMMFAKTTSTMAKKATVNMIARAGRAATSSSASKPVNIARSVVRTASRISEYSAMTRPKATCPAIAKPKRARKKKGSTDGSAPIAYFMRTSTRAERGATLSSDGTMASVCRRQTA
mmetsp:Transcript_13106/g.40736  ORF Transcript_13106/g.40736 Transcript_13106/m.40736 type:complete len:206 (-) Transcript_13106:894-1511(-)